MGDPYDPFDADFTSEPGPGHGRAYLVSGVVGGLVGAAVVLLVWVTIAALGPGDPGRSADARPEGGAPTVLGTESGTPGPSPCRRRFDAQRAALRSADATLAQWEVHVGAMNKLVTGAISLRQATAFWNQTRVGAQDRLARYDEAVRMLETGRAGCPRSAAAGGEDTRCVTAVALRDRTLRRANRATATWRMHVDDMEALRDGTLSPTMATRMWLRSWHRGVRQLDAYHAASRAARGLHC